MHTDRRSNNCGQKCHAQGNRRDTKIQGFMYRDVTDVEYEMYGYTVIRGVTRIVKRFKREIWKLYQENIQKINYKKTVIPGTSHIIRKVLQSEN